MNFIKITDHKEHVIVIIEIKKNFRAVLQKKTKDLKTLEDKILPFD